jgi:hypothetical protein
MVSNRSTEGSIEHSPKPINDKKQKRGRAGTGTHLITGIRCVPVSRLSRDIQARPKSLRQKCLETNKGVRPRGWSRSSATPHTPRRRHRGPRQPDNRATRLRHPDQ